MEKCLGRQLDITTDYTGIGKIQYILGQENMTVLDSVYTDKVEFFRSRPGGRVRWPGKKITEGTSGGAKIGKGDEVWYGTLNKEVILF